MKTARLPALIALTTSILLSGCFNKEAIRPSDILETSAGNNIVLLSTSSSSQSYAFAKGIVISRVGSDGKRSPVTAYFIDSPWEQADIPQNNTKLRWLALEPGAYVIEMGLANPYECLKVAPEFHFSLGASQRVYLGDFRPDGTSIYVLNHIDRDAAYFQSHTRNGGGITFKLLPMQVETVTSGCKNHNAPPIHVFLPHY